MLLSHLAVILFLFTVAGGDGEVTSQSEVDITLSWFETIYITTCLSLSILMFLATYGNKRSQYCGEVVTPKSKRLVYPWPSCEKIKSNCIGDFFGNLEKVKLKNIGVYSAPLAASFSPWHRSVHDNIRLQFFPIDYHAFIVFETDDGRYCSLEKMPEGIFISCRVNVKTLLQFVIIRRFDLILFAV
ncbi:hypothetical protein ACHWQZ_G013439 [Mnemiopsis leidyi]